MKLELVSFELYKKLKEIGCNIEGCSCRDKRPTLELAKMWFRENGFIISVCNDTALYSRKISNSWTCSILYNNQNAVKYILHDEIVNPNQKNYTETLKSMNFRYKTYEYALEAALLTACYMKKIIVS